MAFLLTAVACSEGPEVVPYTYTRFLTGDTHKVWAVSALFIREPDGDAERLILNSCERDDRYFFYNNAERLFEVTNGARTCAADEPATLVTYNWAFNNGNATLTMVLPHIFGNVLVPFIVKRANNTEMELEIYLNEEATISYIVLLEAVEEN